MTSHDAYEYAVQQDDLREAARIAARVLTETHGWTLHFELIRDAFDDLVIDELRKRKAMAV